MDNSAVQLQQTENEKPSIKKSVKSFVYAMIMSYFAGMSAVPAGGVIFFIVALVFRRLSIKNRKQFVKETGNKNGFTKAAKIIVTIYTIIAILAFLVCLVMILCWILSILIPIIGMAGMAILTALSEGAIS